MSVADIVTIIILVLALVGAFILNRHRKKTSSCCGDSSCSGNCSNCSGCSKK